MLLTARSRAGAEAVARTLRKCFPDRPVEVLVPKARLTWLPLGRTILAAGVDVQGDRVEVSCYEFQISCRAAAPLVPA